MSLKIISYLQLVINEQSHLQKGMNYRVKSKNYSVILMSVEKNAPYKDEILDDGKIKYEGHDVYRDKNKKKIDQTLKDDNGKFMKSVDDFKNKLNKPEKVRVYRKIRPSVWVDMGFYNLIDGYKEVSNSRKVFKFILDPIMSDDTTGESISDLLHDRHIPGEVMREVFDRDGGKCVICGSRDNLHLDHKVPFSKGGSSKDPKNIQLLCARHNLKKGNKLLY